MERRARPAKKKKKKEGKGTPRLHTKKARIRII
jgi:hypothetical protein